MLIMSVIFLLTYLSSLHFCTPIIKLVVQQLIFFGCRSGMVTEADWENWSIEDLKPYVQVGASFFFLLFNVLIFLYINILPVLLE